jgi:hypothetical protein
MMIPRCVLALALLIVPSCSHPAAAEWERRIGYLDSHAGNPVIRAPESAAAGQTFTVTVTTLGNSCTRAHGAEVSSDPEFPLLRIVRPYDLHRTAGTCLDIGIPLSRDVPIRFDQAGQAVIRVVGESHPELPNQFEARVTIR